MPKHFPARQTLEAQEAIMRNHLLDPSQVLFCQQNPKSIDSGVFHNDVIATGHNDLFFLHEDAYVHTFELLQSLEKKAPIKICCISKKILSVRDAVATYLFNSQIVSVESETFLVASEEVKKSASCQKAFQKLRDFGIDDVVYVDLSESMKNGGGAACLRLRIPLNDHEWKEITPTVIFTDSLYETLTACIERYYPESLSLKDLCDPKVQKNISNGYKAIGEIFQIQKLFGEG
jgi:succinylarginine dihydrolase